MRIRFLGTALLLGMGVALLPGCASDSGIPAIDRPAKAGDRWPGDPAVLSDNGMSFESSRLLATHNGLDYYAATSEDKKCLLVHVQP
ncbi:hypothetical protein [Glutamicibacter protophormiae]